MIYLDNAATTRMADEAVEAMLPFLKENYGNPSAVHSMGAAAKKALNQARRALASAIGAGQEEIFFTAGGTESDNWALKGAACACRHKGRHIITSAIEHHAVLHTCRHLEKEGFEITYLKVDEDGLVDLEELRRAIRPDTILISVMYANNEIGTVEPIAEIGAMAREKGILFHTDAVQAFGQVPLDVKDLKVDLLSASGHKLNGPKGVGFLYIRSGCGLDPLLHGGAQERNRRAGTENVPGIVGMAAAAQRAMDRMEEKTAKEERLREHLISRIESEIPYCRLGGHRTKRLPGNVNFSFRFVEGESLLIMLDMKGICASSGSACTSGALDPSHVLLAIGRSPQEARGSVRFTLSEDNTLEEINTTVDTLKEILEKLRSMSSEYEEFLRKNGKV